MKTVKVYGEDLERFERVLLNTVNLVAVMDLQRAYLQLETAAKSSPLRSELEQIHLIVYDYLSKLEEEPEEQDEA